MNSGLVSKSRIRSAQRKAPVWDAVSPPFEAGSKSSFVSCVTEDGVLEEGSLMKSLNTCIFLLIVILD